ncbi:amino acid adenylation domain-containing protein [Williamsia sp. SKLECPSW1]
MMSITSMTQAQRALWDLHTASSGAPVTVGYYLSMNGPLDTGLLGQVGRNFVARRATLFLRFEVGIEGVVMVHDPSLDDSNITLDFRGEADPLDAAREWMAADAARPLDPTRDRTALFGLLRIAEDQRLIYMRGHHLVADGVAALQLLDEWGRLYTDAVEGREPSYPPVEDFGPALEADAAYLTSARRERDRAYWREQLTGVPPPPDLSRRAGPISARTHHISGLVPPATSEVIRRVETTHTTTLPAIVGTALTIYLARITGERDVQFALPVAARTVAALKNTPLPVSNVVPIRTQLTDATTTGEVLRATQASMLGALRHQRYRYEDIRADLAAAGTPVPATPGVAGPVLNLMLIKPTVRFGEATGTVQIVSTGPIDDISLTIYPRAAVDGTLDTQIDLDANPNRYTEDEARAHHARFLRVLDEVCHALLDAPDTLVLDLPLLDETERQTVATVAGPTAPEPTSLATLTPEVPEATDLRRVGGVVTIEQGRGDAQTRGIWAATQRPEPLLILDPDLPTERRRRILQLVEQAALPISPGVDHPDLPEYLVFTSGTTGEPKGVVVPRRGIGALVEELRSRFPVTGTVRVAQLAAPAFDATIFEHVLAAALRGTLVPAPPGTLVGPALARFLNEQHITHAVITPTVLATIAPDDLQPGIVATLMTAGEALPAGLAATWARGRDLHNLYGPAETTIMATAARIAPNDDGVVEPTIGRPIVGASVHVLDARLRPVPPGAPGELYVAGPSLALGYLGDTADTAARFVADPFLPEQRMYRTGDLVAWDHDLTGLAYLGRADSQVQIRGVRVELAEIESNATLHPDVDAAAATVVDDTVVLYVVTRSPTTVRPGLRRLFADRLSPAMWPSQILVVDHLPVTGTGKIDRDALAGLSPLDVEPPHLPPATATERDVVAAVSEVLGVTAPSVAADIVDLGATSLNATEIATALARRTGKSITVRDVLAAVSLQELATHIDGAASADVPHRPDRPPASPQQTAMVVSARLSPESTAEVLVGSVTLRGDATDAVAVRAAVADVVARHEILRTVVRVGASGELWQDVVSTDEAIAAVLVDDAPDARAVTDPTMSVPVRVSIHEHDDSLVIAVAAHHALVDDVSLDVLAADLAAAYAARRAGTAPEWGDHPLQYADATAMLATALGDPSDPSSHYSRHRVWWAETLADLPARPRLPAPTGPVGTGASQVSTTVPAALLPDDTYPAVHAAVAAVIARFTGSLDLTLTTVHSGRDLLPARPAIGMFVNPVAVRTRLNPAITHRAMVAEVSAAVREARLHGDIPVADVARAVEPTRAPTTAPLSDVLISYRGVDRIASAARRFGLEIEVHEEPARDPRVPLQWNLDRHADNLHVTLTYDTAVLDAPTAAAMVDAVGYAMTVAASAPDALLHELVPGTSWESSVAVTPERNVVDVVLATASTTPDAIALSDGEVRYRYADVVDAARAIGSGLAALGVGPGDRVAVALPRSGHAVLAQLGVQMTGAAYVPVDVTLPPARIAAILDDAAPAVVLGAVDGHRSVGLDDLVGDPDWQPVPVPAAAEAYVIFTSGSTGRPKGVSVSHRAVVAMLDGVAETYGPDDVFSCVHSLSFDFSVFEILAPWRVGGSVVLADTETARDPAALWRFVQDNRITVLSQTPAAFEALAAYASTQQEVFGPRHIVFGGSALFPDRLKRFDSTAGTGPSFVNMWGITEGAVHVTSTPVDVADSRSLIGEPLPAMAIAILDATLQPVPVGVWGELYISGAQLADGYVGPTARSAERFVAAPGGMRMYRTGDVVRRTHDGNVEYLGRSDDQVQLRGFRVELAEVEAALRAVPGVVDAVASVSGADRSDGGVLVAHVIADEVSPTEILASAAGQLPSYAVPSRVVLVDSWPLTSSGKIDRAALPMPVSGPVVPLSDDGSEHLSAVRAVVGGVLGLEPSAIDPAASLLDLGAQSLSYMHIAVGLASATGKQPAVRDLVTAPTVGALAEVVAAAPAVVDPIGGAPREYMPTSQQRGLWFLHRVVPDSTVYHLPVRIDLDPAVGLDVIRSAALDVAARHEILRTVLLDRDGAPSARVLPLSDAAAHVDAAVAGRQTVGPDLVETAVDDAVRAPFDLGAAPGWRIHLWDIEDDGVVTARVLVVVAHHAVVDGWSVQILGRDVLTALTARVDGRAPDWPDAAPPYSAFAERAAQHGSVSSEVLDHWRATLDGALTHLSLPRPSTAAGPGPEPSEHLEATLASDVRDRVIALADACGATPFHLVHVALTRVLAGIVGESDIVVGVPTAGRDSAADLGAVGMFVRMAVLRTRLDADTSVRQAVSSSASTLGTATGPLAIDYEDLVTGLAPTLGSGRQPYLDVIVAYAENTVDATVALEGPVRSVSPLRVPHARVPLEFTITDATDGLEVVLTVGLSSVDVSAAQRILDDIVATLGALAEAGPDTNVDSLVPRGDDGRLSGPPVGTVLDPIAVFREHAQRSPSSVAVIDGDRRVEYGELAASVDEFVESFRRYGVGPGSRVVVTGTRSAAMLAVMLAVHEVGGTWVPIDASYPAQRQAEITDAVWPALPIVISPDPDGAVFGAQVRMYTPMGVVPTSPRPISDALPAYIIHTSGSTGTPKGVVVTRSNLASMLSATLPLVDGSPSDVWTWTHSPAFDFSVWETWGALTTGGLVVVADGEAVRDPAVLSRLIDDHGVTVLSQTPTAFAGLADRGEELSSLRCVVFGGEALAPSTLAKWTARHPDVRLLNLYGITETTVHLTQQVVDTEDVRSVIGSPLPGMAVLVLDARLRPVPVGGRGELYVVGPQVADGYLGEPGRTAERFVAGPDGQRMYRAGDHVRRIDVNRLEYLGRTDDQVQIRGFRVELGEVTAALRSAADVTDARAVVRPGPRAGDETLVGFVVGAVDTEEVRTHVAQVVPAQAVPALVVAVPSWPLTPTGKVDTEALLRAAAASMPSTRPLTPQEQVVAAVVADLTGADLDGLGPGSSFFALGGSSLTAARLAAALSEVAGTTVSVRSVFDHPTVAALAGLIDAGQDVGVVPVPGPVPMPRPDRLPLTPQQEEIWLQWTLHPDDTGYHLVAAVPVDDTVAAMLRDEESRAAVVERVRALLARHDALRTRYPVDDLGPRQELVDVDDVVVDLTPRRGDDVVGVVAEVLAPFDLAAYPPWRVRVADTGNGMVIGAAIHHIAADGHAIAVLEREIVALTSSDDLPSGSVDFASYTQWYRSMLTARADDLHRFWGHVFAEPIQPIRLPGVASSVGERSGEPSAIAVAVLSEVQELREWAIRHRTTVFIAVHAALASVIARRSASRDVVIGTATSGRVDAAIADTVGMVARTVPLRTEIDVDRPFVEVVGDVTATDLDAFAHADLPAADIAAIADPDRSTAGRALTSIVLSDLMADRERSLALSTDVEALARTGLLRTVFGLDFSVATTDAGLRIALVHRPSTVDETVAQGLVDDVVAVLSSALSHPDVPVGEILVAPTAQRTSVTAQRTSVTAQPTSGSAQRTSGSAQPTSGSAQPTGVGVQVGEGTMGGILAASAAVHPDAVALVDGDWVLTYAEVDARARAIAGALRVRGIGRGDVVAFHAPRSIWSVLALWGISYAGAGFLALNPADPAARRTRILADAAPPVVLTAPGHPADDLVGVLDDAIVLTLDQAVDHPSPIAEPVPVGPDDLAYVIFTSGSTGAPKGVVVSHRGIGPLVATMLAGTGIGPDAVQLLTYAPSFDAHIVELLTGVAGGGRMVICPHDVIGGDAMDDLIVSAGVTVVYSTPAVLGTLDPQRLHTVTLMAIGGEAIPQRIAEVWAPGRRLVNLYGPTETTVVVTADMDMEAGPVDIGTPVLGSDVVVLDTRLRPVPDFTVGELYVRGEALARGYLGRPDLTAERFVADPRHPGARMYRTGDLAHRRADGTLVTHGRTDAQLAVRGLRVEPAEIDAALVAVPGVRDAVSDLHRPASGGDVLAAWVVPDDPDDPPAADEIRRELREMLPRGMVPALITIVDDLPRTANGKLDRRALPVPAVPRGRVARTPTELAIVAVWSEVIGVDAETIDTGTDFFALGGSSFTATRVVGRLREATGRDVTIRQMFDARTVADLAADLDAMPAADARGVRPVHLPTPASTPLAYPQRRMWFLNRLDPDSTAYTVPLVARIVGTVDVERIRRAVRRVVVRHESLRTVYPDTPDGPRQVVLAADDVDLPVVLHADSDDVITQFVTAPVDLISATAFRAALVERDGAWLLVVVMHHVAVDGWSLRTLLADLATAYTTDSDLPAPELTYIDVTRWQLGRLGDPDDPDSDYARQLEFWRRSLAGAGEPLRLPGHDDARTGDGGRVTVALPDDVTAALTTLTQEVGATVFHAVHAAVATVLGRWRDGTDVSVGAPVLGRPDPAMEPVVGMFVNTVVLRTALDPAASVRDTLAAVRDTDLAAMAHDGVPYDAVARAVRPDHRGRHDPLVSVLVVQQEARAVVDPALVSEGITLGDSRVEPIGDIDTLVASKFDVEVVLAPQPDGGLQLIVLHTAAVPASTAQTLADHVVTLLTAAVETPGEPFPLTDDGLTALAPSVAVAEVSPSDSGGAGVDTDIVRAVFAEVLDVEAVGPDDDFFALGGTSLATTQVVAALARRTGRRVPVSEVFAHPTAAGLASALTTTPSSDAGAVAVALERVLAAGPVRGLIPLSTVQRRIWFADRLLREQAATAVYAVPVAVPVPAGVGELEVAAAVRAVVDRHAPLRTVYRLDGDRPYQAVVPSFTPSVPTVDLGVRTWREAIADPPADLMAHLAAPFDIAAAPPVRAALVVAGDDRLLVLVVHHIALDGQSVGLLVRDLADALAGRWLAPLDVTYPQWAVAEQSVPAAVRAAERARVVTALDGYSGVLDVPTDRPRTGDRSLQTAAVRVSLDPAVADAIDARARTAGVTPFHLWHAALVLMLATTTGTDDVAVGTPVSLRSEPEIAAVVGMFVSTVVLRTRLDGGVATVSDLLALVRDEDTAAIGATLVGFDEVVAAVRPPRDPGRHPLVQVLLSLAPDVLPALPIGVTDLDEVVSAPSEFDLQFTVAPDGTAIVTYADALFDRTTAEALGDRWLRAVTALVIADGTGPLDAIDLRSPAEVARDAVDRSVLDIRSEVTLPGVFARAAASFPDDIALDDGEITLTYAALDRRSAAVGAALVEAGVHPGDRVAMMLPRSVASVVATWAIVRVGAVLVPVDPRFPADRVSRMVAMTDVRVAIADGDAADLVVVGVDAERGETAWATPPVDAPAYVIFTSGSTGAPNAVVVTHRGLSLFADPIESGLGPHDRVALIASPSFDASVLEMVRAAGSGARLSVIAVDRVGGRSGTAELARAGVTSAFMTPTVLATLDPDALPTLRSLEVGGEAVPPDLLRRWSVGRRVAAAYGPTEATILVCWWEFDDTPTPGPMLGRQGDSIGVAVLDRRLRPVPDGCVGELYLLGPALAQGYADPALTASRFLAADDGQRMYRTGDLVRRTPAGLAFIGRADQQVQIRGVRVELGEVDAAARAVGVGRSVTVVVAGPSGDTLVTYAVTDRPGAQVREAMAAVLPSHLVPAQVIVVDGLPVTTVGKLDVAALPTPVWAGSGDAPQTPTEEAAVAVFRSVLDDASIGVRDDFFAVGGTSLQLIPLVTALRDRLGVDVGLADVVVHPTPAAVAASIDAGEPTGIPDEIAVLLRHVVDLPPHPAERAETAADRADTPLWLVHPVSGLASMYAPLTQTLGGGAVGLQLPDLLDGDVTAPSTIDALAKRHLAAVRERQPHGPYRFGGWSVGGQIAHAMARLIVEAGETVDLLVLLDARVGVDVAGTDDEIATIDAATADALRAADPHRFANYERRVAALARSAAAFIPEPTTVAHTVLVVASDTSDDAVDRWRAAVPGRLTVLDVAAPHAEVGEPATMRAIGEMLAIQTAETDVPDTHTSDTDTSDTDRAARDEGTA